MHKIRLVCGAEGGLWEYVLSKFSTCTGSRSRVWVAGWRKNAVGTLDVSSNQWSSEFAASCKNLSSLKGCKRGRHVCFVCFTTIQRNALK